MKRFFPVIALLFASAHLVSAANISQANASQSFFIDLSAFPNSVPADNYSYSSLTAFLYSSNGSVPGQTVSFYSTLGFFDNGYLFYNTQTNSTGFAVARLYSNQIGNAFVSAEALNASANVTVTFYNATPSPSPSPTPSPTPSPSPSPSPSPTPSQSPSASPSPSALPSPHATATASPTPSIRPTPSPSTTFKPSLSVVVFETNEPIQGSRAFLGLNGVVREYADAPPELRAELEPGEWTVVLKTGFPERKLVSKPETFDVAAGEFKLVALELFPAGSLSGVVLDENGSRAENASVLVACPGFASERVETNSSGEFEVDFVPAGACDLLANYEGRSACAGVFVSEQKPTPVTIRFEVELSEEFSWALVAAVFAALALAAFLFFKKFPPRKLEHAEAKPKPPKPKQEPAEPSPGMKAVMHTLSEREKAVVEFLLSCRGKATQSKIRHALLIPKTSLFRVIASLEKKNIVEKHGVGNLFVVRLSEWFKSQ